MSTITIMRMKTVEDRLLAYSDRSAGPAACWPWTRCLIGGGYGQISTGGGEIGYAHRLAYEQAYGGIPEELVVDHSCHNVDLDCSGGPTCRHRRCVNPAHLVLVDRGENVRRGERNGDRHELCRAGLHRMGEPDAWVTNGLSKYGDPRRTCRKCRTARR